MFMPAMEYIKKFCVKQDMYLDYMVNDEPDGIICVNDLHFNFADIKTDIDYCFEKGTIIKYYYYCIEQISDKTMVSVNYYNFAKHTDLWKR